MKLLRWIKAWACGIAVVAVGIAIWFVVKFLVVIAIVALIAAGVYYNKVTD